MVTTYLGLKGSDALRHFANILNEHCFNITADELRGIASAMKSVAICLQVVEENKEDCLRELVEYHNQTSSLRYIIPGITDNDFEKEWD